MELLFTITNISVIPAWILIAFFSKHQLSQKLVFSYAWHTVLAVFYALFIIWGMLENNTPGGGMDSLEALRIGFVNDKVLLAAWIHYLVFDLFVGTWIVQDANSKNINFWFLKVILFCTLMLGPIGFFMYKLFLVIRNKYSF